MATSTTTATIATFDFRFYGLALSICLISTLLLRTLTNRRKKQTKSAAVNHPPSPPRLPIIGHIHLLGAVLSKSLQALAAQYGPLMKLSLGPQPAIVVSNEVFAREMLKNNELIFVSRPNFGASGFNIYEGSAFVNAEYGAYWRFMKKLCMTELLSAPQINKFIDLRREEVMKLVAVVADYSAKGSAIDLGEELMIMTNNIICRLAMSTRCSASADESREIRRLVKGILDIAPKFSLGEMLGPLGKLDLFGYGKKVKGMMTEFDDLVERIMREHEERTKTRGGGGGAEERERRDMMDILLEISGDETAEVKITRKDIKSFFMEIFMAGTETVSVALKWTLAELINHPEVYKKLRDEIKTVVGSRLVEEVDVPNLPYLQALVKEALRLHAPAPLIFRKARENCKILGYDIPANTRIIFNAYAIMRDPGSWEEPLRFVPERFLVSVGTEKHYLNQVDIKGRSFNYMPFGSGRRGCPGSTLASTVVHLTVATLVQCFDWKIKDGDKLDTTEGLGLSSGMAQPILCYPITHFSPWENTTPTE